jgi:hypothetical protein
MIKQIISLSLLFAGATTLMSQTTPSSTSQRNPGNDVISRPPGAYSPANSERVQRKLLQLQQWWTPNDRRCVVRHCFRRSTSEPEPDPELDAVYNRTELVHQQFAFSFAGLAPQELLHLDLDDHGNSGSSGSDFAANRFAAGHHRVATFERPCQLQPDRNAIPQPDYPDPNRSIETDRRISIGVNDSSIVVHSVRPLVRRARGGATLVSARIGVNLRGR